MLLGVYPALICRGGHTSVLYPASYLWSAEYSVYCTIIRILQSFAACFLWTKYSFQFQVWLTAYFWSHKIASRCDRLCINCNDVEDEIHFLVYCKLYEESRHIFYQKVARRNSDFLDFTDYEKYIFLMKTTDPFILVWFGKYVFKLFNIRTEHNMMF